MNPYLILAAEGLVAVLLVASILTSVVLSRRINRMKADESAMREVIGELVTATETAQRAIGGLRATLAECDRTLAERLRAAERSSATLADQVEAGELVMNRMTRIVDAARDVADAGLAPSAPRKAETENPQLSRIEAAVSAAQALSERALRRIERSAA